MAISGIDRQQLTSAVWGNSGKPTGSTGVPASDESLADTSKKIVDLFKKK